MLKIVFTGQSYSGKTTLINELLKINKEFISVQESAMQVIGELKSKMGEEQKKWMMENFQQFQKMIMEKQVFLESQLPKLNEKTILFDRTILDGLAFCQLRNVSLTEEMKKLINENFKTYDYVFFCDMLSEFDLREETGRVITKIDSMKSGKILEQIYKEYNHPVIHIPEFHNDKEMNLKARIYFVLSILKENHPNKLPKKEPFSL